MKKNKILLIAAVACTSMFSSCSDLLDLYPEDSLSDPKFWTSVQDLELYANGFYGILPGAQGPGADDESDCYVNEKPKTWIFNLETIPNVNAVLFFGRPVFVTDYPKEIKAFYMKQNPDGKTVAATDLLVPGIGEIIGGSQREENYEKLNKRLEELGLKKEDYWWYMDLRRYGSCVHSGFGLGFERMMMYLTGMQNIRDVLPFPRTPKNCEF